MAAAAFGPVSAGERISEIDIIRGLALFGVLWMNLFAHGELATPEGHLATLTTRPFDEVVGFFTLWIAAGKAQALFSLLFGFGFALLLDRIEGRGGNGTRIYLRRLSILLVVGIAHLLLVWTGDILHAYAAMGFVLLLTRKWSGRALLGAGVALALLGPVLAALVEALLWGAPGQPPAHLALWTEGAARRYVLFQASDYGAYVVELTVSAWREFYALPIGWAYLGWILGRFMIGSWIYRQGWFQDTRANAPQFRRAALVLLPLGLALALVGPLLGLLEIKAQGAFSYALQFIKSLSQLVLALGYGAGIVLLCRSALWRTRLSGLGTVGQMALTNYLIQSLVYLYVLYGFGLGLLPSVGATFCLLLALAVFSLQIMFSRWWLSHYRFGPAEWLWRSLTYGTRQPLRSRPRPQPLAAE